MFSDLGNSFERNSLFSTVENVSYKFQEFVLVKKAKTDTVEDVNNLLDFWREKRAVLVERGKKRHKQAQNKEKKAAKAVPVEILA